MVLLLLVDRLLCQLTYRADDTAAVAVVYFYPSVWDAFTMVARGGQLGAWWRPLADASVTFDWAVAPVNAGFSFVVNELVHIANAFMAASLLRRFKPDSPAPYILFLLVLFHPAGVQTVPMLTQRPDLAGSFFFLLAIRLYLDYLDGGARSMLVLSFLSFLGSLGFKEMMMTLPAVALLAGFAFARLRGLSIRRAALVTGIFWVPLIAYWIARSLLIQNPLAYQELLGEDWIVQQLARMPLLVYRSLLAVFGDTGTSQFHLAGSLLLVGGFAFSVFFMDRRRLAASAALVAAAAVSFTPVWTFADQIHPRFAYLPSILFLIAMLNMLGHERGMMRPVLALVLGVLPVGAWAVYHDVHLRYEKRVRDGLDHQLAEVNRITLQGDPETYYWIVGWSPDQYFADIQRRVVARTQYVGGRVSGIDFSNYIGFFPESPPCKEFNALGERIAVKDFGFHKVTLFATGGGGYCMGFTSPADMDALADHPERGRGYRFLLWENGQYRELTVEEALAWKRRSEEKP